MDGRVVVAPGVALIWLPWDGEAMAKIPASQGNRRWLHRTVDIRSPHLDNRGYWHLPRTCLGRLVMAAIDRYGYVVLCRDMSELSRCTRKCQEATGLECNCSCRGAHHGEEDPDGWFERVGDVIVDERGEFTRTFITYGPKGSCAGCLTAPARVWDHCHRHGYVRAPLCNTCYWSGWHPQYGRTTPSSNLDTTYYRWCPQYDAEGQHPCSS
ncbi:endonuclease domain-containing protein [Nonomuraea jabiensis]|uniref:endonuclease domain-containing protein n=1 Tax=Nonomuraea jabiensis TaxID=882448 RepID=UPI0036C9213C